MLFRDHNYLKNMSVTEMAFRFSFPGTPFKLLVPDIRAAWFGVIGDRCPLSRLNASWCFRCNSLIFIRFGYGLGDLGRLDLRKTQTNINYFCYMNRENTKISLKWRIFTLVVTLISWWSTCVTKLSMKVLSSNRLFAMVSETCLIMPSFWTSRGTWCVNRLTTEKWF